MQHHMIQARNTPSSQFITTYHLNFANLTLFPNNMVTDNSALSATHHVLQACRKGLKERGFSLPSIGENWGREEVEKIMDLSSISITHNSFNF